MINDNINTGKNIVKTSITAAQKPREAKRAILASSIKSAAGILYPLDVT